MHKVSHNHGEDPYPLAKSVLERLETPAVLVDRGIMRANIDHMQKLADQAGLHLRPHIKTHKSVAIARRQLAAGACGLTASKVDEALVFIEAGLPSLTLAYPQTAASKLDRLLAAARRHGCDLRLIVDSMQGLALLKARASQIDSCPGVFIKIDVGLHRCGLRSDDPLVPTLAAMITRSACLDFRGLLSHAGQAYGAEDGQTAGRIAEEERQCMVTLADDLRQAGFRLPEVSVGATPTVLAARRFDGVTEIRPGNYVFMDQTPLRLGLIRPAQLALSVLSSVVSVNDRYAIIDAGSKTLSSDRGAHGLAGVAGYGLAFALDETPGRNKPLLIEKLSEEHGFAARNGHRPKPGDRLQIFPNHACPVVNLTRRLYTVEGDAIETWPVDAAGCVR